jgi:hypothetical protein
MERDQDFSFEWVNAWAEATDKLAAAALPQPAPPDFVPAVISVPDVTPAPAAPAAEQCLIARISATMPADQLIRDIAEIEFVRDRLAALPISATLVRRTGQTQALTLVAARTTDPVPVVIGGVFALVMLTVFGAAAAMTRLAR